MKPVLFVLPVPWVGPLAIKSYGVMLMLGFLFGLWLALARARKEKVSTNVIWDFWVYALIGGIVGSRLLYVLEFPSQFKGRLLDIFRVWEGGLSFYGGFALAILATWVMLRVRKVSGLKLYDIMAIGLALGLAFGKIGCFLNGCCFGKPTDSFIGVTYPAAAAIDGQGHTRPSPAFQWQVEHKMIPETATRTLAVHPVQLYEATGSLTIMVILLGFYPHRRRYGEVTCLMGTVYPLARFFFEFFRQRQEELVLGLSPEQVFSVIAFVVFAVVFIVSRKTQPALPGR